MSDLGYLVAKLYGTPGVLGLRGDWEDPASVKVRVRFDTPALRASIEAVLNGQPYTLDVVPLTPERARELDDAIRTSGERARRYRALKASGGVLGDGWGATGARVGAYGLVLRQVREGR